jgi:hypothetical protein
VGEADSVPFFDEARVPVETIELPDPQIEGLSADQYEVISQKVSYRLAQRPGSYVILKYLRSVIKRVDTQAISCAPAPVGVIDGSRADVSFVVWPVGGQVRLPLAFVSPTPTPAGQRHRCQPTLADTTEPTIDLAVGAHL